MVSPSPESSRSERVRIVLERVERDAGPLFKTHHWHAEAWVGGEKVCSCWCFSRDLAMEEALGRLADVDVGGIIDV